MKLSLPTETLLFASPVYGHRLEQQRLQRRLICGYIRTALTAESGAFEMRLACEKYLNNRCTTGRNDADGGAAYRCHVPCVRPSCVRLSMLPLLRSNRNANCFSPFETILRSLLLPLLSRSPNFEFRMLLSERAAPRLMPTKWTRTGTPGPGDPAAVVVTF